MKLKTTTANLSYHSHCLNIKNILGYGGLALVAVGCGTGQRDWDASETSSMFLSPQSLERQPLVVGETPDFIDIRGVGDSGWSGNHDHDGYGVGFGAALDKFDPQGVGYRGDLSFINWETAVGTSCSRFRPDQFAFLTLPGNIEEAYNRGFNLLGLSNNHTRDCYNQSGDGESGTQNTINHLVNLGRGKSWLWTGVTPGSMKKADPKVRTFRIKGRDIKVAFNSFHAGRDNCPYANCWADRVAILQGLAKADADIRVLAIHTLEFGDEWKRIESVGAEFVKNYKGDVVFGHGPHIWKPVRVVERADGEKGVVFTSLGNFIHPQLSAQSRNAIGRVLFDPEAKRIRQIQVLGVRTDGGSATYGNYRASEIGSLGTAIPWTDFTESRGGRTMRGAYVNLE